MKKLIQRISGVLLFAAGSLCFIGCPKTGPDPVTPQPPVIVDTDKCAAACSNLQRLGCEEGNPIDMHTKCLIQADCATGQQCSALGTCMVTCTQFCIDTQNQGVWLDPVCVSQITACDQINSCPLPHPQKAGKCTENSCPIIAN